MKDGIRAIGFGMAGWLSLAATPALARDYLVRDPAHYQEALAKVQPGDVIQLANGEWKDFAVSFVADGNAGKPITLTAQTPGKVVLTGQSSLAIGGSHLVVSNLVFKGGAAPGKHLIATRGGKKKWSDNVRLTGIVVDGFTKPDRRAEDAWVALYGTNIRVDHSHFAGKANAGAMMVVVREKGLPLDNRIQIDHVYFGPRPVLGANGGETLRIGTSDESLSNSHTIVEDNYFDHCDGEVEIVSVKSGGNIVRRNVFFQSQGSVVLRHGNGNLVADNIFLGGGVPHTGGVRVINEGQSVRGNYMEGLAGVDFTSAITVMNGVPNSPLNRYMAVKNAVIARNTIIDPARITLGAGASEERSLAPSSTRFADNLIVTAKGRDPFRSEASLAGISFSGNVATTASKLAGIDLETRAVAMKRGANGLLYPTDPALAAKGASASLRPISRAATGVSWYPKPSGAQSLFGSGKTLAARDGASLAKAVTQARPGDIIALAAGRYHVTRPLVIDRAVSMAGPSSGTAAQLSFAAPTLFQLENGGRLQLRALTIDGSDAPRQAGNAVIRSSARPMTDNYAIELIDSRFENMAASPGFDVIATTPATLAQTIMIDGGSFTDVSGAVLAAHSETGKEGFYNAENVSITGAHFTRVATLVDLYRGGTDESTYGPIFTMEKATVANSGPLLLSGVQETRITQSRFSASKGMTIIHSVGSPSSQVSDNSFSATPRPVVTELYYKGPARAVLANNRSAG